MAEIHESADVQTSVIGDSTQVWQYVVILPDAQIGDHVNICSHCFIENDVSIGDHVTVKSGVQIWDGARIADHVFIGPNVTFTNDKFPRSKNYPEQFQGTTIDSSASIGGGAVLLPGIRIGVGAMVGAGAVVTKSVPPYAIVTGNPARIVGYVESGQTRDTENDADDSSGQQAAFPTQESVKKIGVGDVTLHRLKLVNDMRGDLSVGEFMKEIPFGSKRYFLVFNVPSEKTRGEHAHRECHQFMVCVKGGCSVVVDDGEARQEIRLDSPELGIHLPPMTWGIQYKYTSDAVLLVFTSEYYEASDYIRDYGQFVEMVNSTK